MSYTLNIGRKFASLLSAFSLIVQMLLPVPGFLRLFPTAFAQENQTELAQEQQPSSSDTAQEPKPTPTPTQEPTLTSTLTPYQARIDQEDRETPTSESTQSAQVEAPITPVVELSSPDPSSITAPTPSPTPAPVWTNLDGAYTTEILKNHTVYKFPPNKAVSIMFTTLPERSGTVTIKEYEIPPTVYNAASKDYEITSDMPNGSFSFDLTLPTNNPNKSVLTSQDGRNYEEVSNEKTTSPDAITIKGITHLTHFIVGDDTDDFLHPVINEFVSNTSDDEWIELYNPTSEIVNIQNWEIKQLASPSDNPSEATFLVLSGEIPAKDFIIVAGDGLNNTGDWIGLYNAENELIDQVSFGNVDSPYNVNTVDNPSAEKSAGRVVDGGPDFTVFDTPTRGISNGTTLETTYVDDDWDGPDNDGGHTWGFDAFSNIQDAVNAVNGSTVYVLPGTYEESITIDKELTLSGNAGDDGVGPGENAPTITSCGKVITVDASNVTVSGFILDGQECGDIVVRLGTNVTGSTISDNEIAYGYRGVALGGGNNGNAASSNTIENNNIHSNDTGVRIDSADNNIVQNNSIHNNDSVGILISDNWDTPSGNQILNNTITQNGGSGGIYFDGSQLSDLTINGNIITDNSSIGIYLSGNSGELVGAFTISENTISSNDGDGIYTDYLIDSTFDILNNTIGSSAELSGNSGYGIYFYQITGSDVTISDNGITDNSYDGIYIDQIEQLDKDGETKESTMSITDNSITGNGAGGEYSGIYINNIYDSVLDINDNSDISDNSGKGIYICGEGQCERSTIAISRNQISSNDNTGIYLYQVLQNSTVTVDDNIISGNGQQSVRTGIYIDYLFNGTLDITDNDILENFGNGIEISRIEEDGADTSVSVSANTIDQNTGYGIYLQESDEESDVQIGENNEITNNTNAGIYLGSGVLGVQIEGNTIIDNGGEGNDGELFTGIVVQNAQGNEAHNNKISGNEKGVINWDESTIFDARKNWWGAASGPQEDSTNPNGEGDRIEGVVWYRSFFVDEALEAVSTLNIDPVGLPNLINTGIFSLPKGETSDSVTQVTVEEDITLTVDDSGNQSTVFLPVGTVISSANGAPLDISDLTADDIDEDSLTGLGTGVTADGALQWGIPNLGLEFSQPITLNIFVGAALNGQTLNILRSTDGVTWTDNGIEMPKTCVVIDGMCSFQATKASTYATTRTVTATTTSTTSSTSATSGNTNNGGGSGTSKSAPVCGDTAPGGAPTLLSAVSGLNSVTLHWTAATGPLTYYLVAYGLSPGSLLYGNPNVGGPGTSSYTVGGLSGGSTYYFRVRAGNGCAPGPYSNELSAGPAGAELEGPAAGFEEGVLGEATVSGQTPESTPSTQIVTQEGNILGKSTSTWPWWLLFMLLIAFATWWKLRQNKHNTPS